MPSARRFERIAQDLEKLPCELHDEILVSLEFHQLIRLSKLAGPRLEWSLKNSLAPWSIYFRVETKDFQKLLDITDQVRKLCFKPSKKVGKKPDTYENLGVSFLHYRNAFENFGLSFLHYRNADWTFASRWGMGEPADLSKHWLRTLHFPLIKRRILLLFEKYRNGNRDVAACTKMADFIESSPWPDWFSVDDFARYIELDHTLRQAVAGHVANDLNRLASLYEAHPTRLKTPFAPQTRRFNDRHVPFVLRRKAKAVERKARNASWIRARTQYHLQSRFSFPDLVPYDWCLRLFALVLQDVDLSSSAYPAEMVDKCMMVFEEAPSWAIGTTANANTRAQVIAETAENKLVFCSELSLSNRDTQPSPIRPEAELDWLEDFVTVVAWMEGEFPDLLEQVRTSDWDARA